MKKTVVALTLLLWMDVSAQVNIQEFQQNFAYGLRVAEMPCPEQLRSTFTKATCYRHGYANFFDFKEAVAPYMFEPGSHLEPWHVVTMTFGSEAIDTFQARYRLRKNSSQLTLTYLSESLLVLEVGDLRATP